MKWVWAGIFALLALVCLTGLGAALYFSWVTGDLLLLLPAVTLAATGTYSGMGAWAVLDS